MMMVSLDMLDVTKMTKEMREMLVSEVDDILMEIDANEEIERILGMRPVIENKPTAIENGFVTGTERVKTNKFTQSATHEKKDPPVSPKPWDDIESTMHPQVFSNFPEINDTTVSLNIEELETSISPTLWNFDMDSTIHPEDFADFPKNTDNNTTISLNITATAMPTLNCSYDTTRYCFCNDVSYGDMIACDNLSCPREWFHFACVNLKVVPKGKWFCQACRKGGKKRRKTSLIRQERLAL